MPAPASPLPGRIGCFTRYAQTSKASSAAPELKPEPCAAWAGPGARSRSSARRTPASSARRTAGLGLVGDAGYHKDPYLAQGISDAWRGAELLAEAIDAGLGGRQPLDGALAEYERRRTRRCCRSMS